MKKRLNLKKIIKKFEKMTIKNTKNNQGYLYDVHNDSDFIIESDSDSDTIMIDCEYKENKPHTVIKNTIILDYTYAYCVMSIDIGIIHMGVSISTLHEDFSLIDVVWIDLIDITKFTHYNGPSEKNCKLHHTKTFSDWLRHVFQEYHSLFNIADYILLERQPPIGLVAVEQLIFDKWREKAILVSPNSMHKYLRINHFCYEKRKEETEKIAKRYITDKIVIERLKLYNRKHDISDSICIMLFWIHKKQTVYEKEKRIESIMNKKMKINENGKVLSVNEWFEQFRYTTI